MGVELSSAYETLIDPSKRTDYDIHGKRFQSRNSEETLSNALQQIFAEFMAGDFDNLMQIVGYINAQNPELAVNEESAKKFFHQVRDVVLVTSKYVNVAKFEIMKLIHVQQQLRQLSYFDVLGRLRLTVQMTRIFLSIPVRMNQHVTDRQIMGSQMESVLGGVAGLLEAGEQSLSGIGSWAGRMLSWR
jgi:uncharacterized protein (UPF0297 family)